MRMNILQGVQPHQLDQGCYINGPQSSKQHSIQMSLDRYAHLIFILTISTRSLRRGSLKRKLVNRQPLTDVIRSGVLRGKRLIVLKICKERACDPSLVSIQLHLERQFTLLQLQQRIDTRKSVRELRLLNVFQGSEDSFTVLTTANATDLDLDACNHYHLHTKGPALENQMGRRLAVDALERVGIVRDLRSLALMICPSVRGKIRQFETQQ